MVDAQGQPKFTPDVVPIVLHEFTHSYTNPLVDQFAHQLQGPAGKICPLVADAMRKQAYAGWRALMVESVNRACVLRYILATEGPRAMQKAIAYEKSRSFYWVGELAEVLGEYDAESRKYGDLAQFFPRIIAFFDDYARNVDTKLGFLKAEQERKLEEQKERGPKIVAMVPANGAQDVDPGLQALVVTFDRPMRDQGWAVVTFSPGPVPQDHRAGRLRCGAQDLHRAGGVAAGKGIRLRLERRTLSGLPKRGGHRPGPRRGPLQDQVGRQIGRFSGGPIRTER